MSKKIIINQSIYYHNLVNIFIFFLNSLNHINQICGDISNTYFFYEIKLNSLIKYLFIRAYVINTLFSKLFVF